MPPRQNASGTTIHIQEGCAMARSSYRTPFVAREVEALLAEWQQGRLSRRAVLRRAAALGLSGAALAMLLGHAGGGRAAAAALRALQDDPAAGTPGGTLRVATIGEAPHLD